MKLEQTPNPWHFRSRREIFDNPWMRLLVDEVINPGGGTSHYGWVDFKNIAIGVVPLDEHDNTWLVGQYRYATDNYSWEIPMGGGPMNVDPLLSAQRELREETGITAQDWQELMQLHLSNSITNERSIVYVARDLSYGDTEFEETEELKILKLPLEQAIELACQGKITDAVSVASLLRLAALQPKR